MTVRSRLYKYKKIDYSLIAKTQIITPTSPGLYDWQGRPSMVNRSGVWILITKEGTHHNAGGGILNINFSVDEGTTWSTNNVFTDASNVVGFPYTFTDPAANYSSEAELILCANGDLLCISREENTAQVDVNYFDGGNWQRRSVDGGKTWTVDFELSTVLPGVPDKHKMWSFFDYTVIGSDLYIVAAQYTTDITVDSWVTLWKSTNNGTSYTKISEIFASLETSPAPNECGIEHAGSGHMIAISRTINLNKTIRRDSYDYGATWSTIIDISNLLARDGVHQPKLDLFGTRLFLAGRAYRTSTRWMNAFWYSDDLGETWNPVILDPGLPEGGYTKILLKSNGSVYAVGYSGASLASAQNYKFTTLLL